MNLKLIKQTKRRNVKKKHQVDDFCVWKKKPFRQVWWARCMKSTDRPTGEEHATAFGMHGPES